MTPLVFRIPKGYCLDFLNISQNIVECIKKNDWNNIDKEFQSLTQPGGEIYNYLLNYIYFEKIEIMLSIRDAENPWEEDGIWHDDGSRVLAFSLSLTLDPEDIEGGHLGIRKKGETEYDLIPTPKLGQTIVFLTGVHGFEHKIHAVTKGRRIVLVGWCS